MANKNIRRGPSTGGAPSDFTNRAVANDIYVDGLSNLLIIGTGSSGVLSRQVLTTLDPLVAITGSGAVTVAGANYVVTLGSAAAMTLAAPTAAQAGMRISITSRTAFAHTLTATGLLNTGSASVNVATFAAFAGAGLTLVADNLKWNVVAQIGITFS